MATDPTRRFSNRVDDYVKYRPSYPAGVVSWLQGRYGENTDVVIADIGAGTGISSKLFLDAGCRVIAVEPNREMREKAQELLAGYPGFSATDGAAEDTGLEAASIDWIVCGQAFHWFDVPAAKTEFRRILKPGGLVLLLWNERLVETPFEQEYEQLIGTYGRQYRSLNHRNVGMAQMEAFYDPEPVHLQTFTNEQVFDYEGLKGRLLSSSYMPLAGDDGYEAMLDGLHSLFERYQQAGQITIHYTTKLYCGAL